MKSVKGQVVFIGLILISMAIIMAILALPMLSNVIGNVNGGVESFFARLIPWVILGFLFLAGLRLVAYG